MIKYKIRSSDWLTFPLIIVNFNHFFIQPAPDQQRIKEDIGQLKRLRVARTQVLGPCANRNDIFHTDFL